MTTQSILEEQTQRQLYKDSRITITQAETPDEHNVKVETLYCYLSRGILRQLSQRDTRGLRQDLSNVNSDFLYGLDQKRIPLEELGWALAKARMVELDREVQYFIREYNELKAKID